MKKRKGSPPFCPIVTPGSIHPKTKPNADTFRIKSKHLTQRTIHFILTFSLLSNIALRRLGALYEFLFSCSTLFPLSVTTSQD